MYRLTTGLQELAESGIMISVKAGYAKKPDSGKRVLLAELAGTSELIPEEDGFLLSSEKVQNFFLIMTAPVSGELRAITVSGRDRVISSLSNLSDNEDLFSSVKIVHLYDAYGGKTTKPPDNSFRVVSVAGGRLKMFEISVATRIYPEEGSCHFLAVQKMYEARLLRDISSGIIVPEHEFPGYRNWPALQNLVSEMIGTNPIPFWPDRQQQKAETETFGPDEGRVLYFNICLAHGRIMTSKGVCFVHWTQIDTEDRMPYLESGQKVIFSGTLEKSVGIELLGVRPV